MGLFEKNNFKEKIKSLWQLVGFTPMLEVRYRYQSGPVQRIYVKGEQHHSLTGSIKDRMALYIIEKAYEQSRIKPGDKIVEATSGNSGIAFAAIGRMLKHPVMIIMPDWMSRERIELIKSFGAEIRLVSKAEGGFLGSIRMAEIMAHNERVFLPRQFENQYNVEAHEKTTGREINHQLILQKLEPDAFVAGVGTGGTVMGVGRHLKKFYPQVKIHPLEPMESPTLTTGHKVGSHRIQGISDEFIPAIVRLETLDPVVQVSDGDAILMAQQLSRKLGLAVGISSGANLIGAIKVQQQMKKESVVVTVFPDSSKKYLSTALFGAEPIKDFYESPHIELLEYHAIK